MDAIEFDGLLAEIRASSRHRWSASEMSDAAAAVRFLRGGRKGGHIAVTVSIRSFEENRDKMRVMPDNWNSGG